MRCKRRAARIVAPLVAALAIAAAQARADGGAPVRIRDVRVGAHASFERLVIELDSEAEVVWENGPEPGEESFYIAASPMRPSQVIATRLPHVGTVSVTEMKGGTHIAVEPRERSVRAYTLSDPPRLVVDFAAPAQGGFEAPAGARALEPARTLGPLVLEPEVAHEPAPEPEPEVAHEPAPEPEPEVAHEPAPEPEPTTPEARAEPEAPALREPAPEPAPAHAETPPTKPQKAPTPEPTPSAPRAQGPRGPFLPYGLAIAALLGLALVIAAGVMFARRRAARAEPETFNFSPEAETPFASTRVDEISPAEILAAGDHDVLLEKRLDEEVRARFELEQRFASANEELKVLRDRLHRLERRREGAD